MRAHPVSSPPTSSVSKASHTRAAADASITACSSHGSTGPLDLQSATPPTSVRTPATIDSRHPAAASGRERGRAAARSTCRSAMRGRSEQRDPPPSARPDDTRTPSRLQRAGVVQMVQREPGEDEEVNAASANDRFATAPRTNSRLVNRSRAAAPRRRPFGCVLPSHVQPRQDPAAARPPQFGGDPQATPAAVRVAKGIRCASRG